MYYNLYDLIISDIMMPEIDGFEFAENVRRVNKHFMSAKDDLPSKQKGFQLGIDDYMVKPIELDELLLRVRALLRRANIEMERELVVGNLELDADELTAAINGEEIPVTTREFNILYKLLSYPKKTFTRAQLMDGFWGIESNTSLRAVDVYVTRLRDKFFACDGFKIVNSPRARLQVGVGIRDTLTKPAVRQSRFPGILCVVYFLVLLLMSGIHMGLVTSFKKSGEN